MAGLRVAFAGTPDFAAVALRAVHEAGHTVALVLTQPDRPAGRGLKVSASPVKQLALALGLPLGQPSGLRLDGRHAGDAARARDALVVAGPEVMVVAAYGLILSPWVLALPRLGCLNIHASLLPRWRGAAPIHRAVEAGDECTGVTIMQMDAGLDTGDMLMAQAVPIAPGDTTGRLHDRLAALGARLIVSALDAAQRGTLAPVRQPEAGVTYAHKIAKAEAAIDWQLPAEAIERRVRAFDPFPGATFVAGDETVKLWAADVVPVPAGAQAPSPGTVLEATSVLVVACGSAALALREIQRPGGRRQPAEEWLRGGPLREGDRLVVPAAGAL